MQPKTTGGQIDNVTAADSFAQDRPSVVWNIDINTARVGASVRVSVSAMINSFQQKITVRTAHAASPPLANGRTTATKEPRRDSPSG